MTSRSLVSKFALTVFIALAITSCQGIGKKIERYQTDFYGLFDTHTILLGYTESEEEFLEYAEIIYDEMERLHKLLDIYNYYDGINNIKTINSNAGVEPVEVHADLIRFMEFAIEAYHLTDGVVNVAGGSVLKEWHDYRAAGREDPQYAELPNMNYLIEMSHHIDINNIIIDREKNTIYLSDSKMSLDVGSLGKGYAVEKAMNLAQDKGLKSALISAGGQVKAIGKPLDGQRDKWGIGVQDPKLQPGGVQNILDTVFFTDLSISTSGGYQRFYTVDGKKYSHLIDLNTLLPAERYASVSVISEDSGIADMLTTVMFIVTQQEGAKLLDKFNASGIWIYEDGSQIATEGYRAMSKNFSN